MTCTILQCDVRGTQRANQWTKQNKTSHTRLSFSIWWYIIILNYNHCTWNMLTRKMLILVSTVRWAALLNREPTACKLIDWTLTSSSSSLTQSWCRQIKYDTTTIMYKLIQNLKKILLCHYQRFNASILTPVIDFFSFIFFLCYSWLLLSSGRVERPPLQQPQ